MFLQHYYFLSAIETTLTGLGCSLKLSFFAHFAQFVGETAR